MPFTKAFTMVYYPRPS